MSTEIKLSWKSLLGVFLLTCSLIILAFVTTNAYWLATGTMQPLRIQMFDSSGRALIPSPESQVSYGIIIQIGMYAILVGVASVLMKNGVAIVKTS